MVRTDDSQSSNRGSTPLIPTKEHTMKLSKDEDGLYVSIKTKEQVELCDYILVNEIRFVKENSYERGTRLKQTNPATGHTYGCPCFICNH